jgi:hypothetical protein
VGHTAYKEVRSVYIILVAKCEGRRPIGRHRNKCGYYNNGSLKMIWSGDVNSIQVAQGSDQWWNLVNMKTNLHFFF